MRDICAVLIALAVLSASLPGCTRHAVEVKPIRVEPIHVTIDINIKVQEQLEGLFAFEDEMSEAETKDKAGKDGT